MEKSSMATRRDPQSDPLKIVRPSHPSPARFFPEFADAMAAGNVTNNGPHVREFEAALTSHLGVPTIVFSSGQAALMTMLLAAGVRGGEVIVPSFTFCATPHAVKWAGAEPVFVDIDPDTLCIDPAAVRAAITGKTRAVLGVDPYGIQCDTQALANASGGPPIFIDSAPSFGSTAMLSRAFDAKIFSFHATKALSCMEGGALCSNDPYFIAHAKRIRNFGQDESGDCTDLGINGKMLEVCAMIGLRQLETWGAVSAWRKQFAHELAAKLDGIEGLTVVKAPYGQFPIWLYLPVLIDEQKFGMSRDAFAEKMQSAGIGVRTYYRPCHTLSCYDNGQSLPVTERIAEQVIALPVYNDMRPDEIALIGDVARNIKESVR